MSDIYQLQQSKERRAARRARIVVRVECRTPRTFAQGNAENISEIGMLITCRETFEVSQTITIRFALPLTPQKSVVISTGAVVVRTERGRFMGIQFLGLRQAFRASIVEYIERASSSAAAATIEVVPNKKQ